MIEDTDKLNTEIPTTSKPLQESTAYKDATSIGNTWESTEVPLPPPPPVAPYESSHEVVVVSDNKRAPFIFIPLFIIVLAAFMGITFLLFKQNIMEYLQPEVVITPSPKMMISPPVASPMETVPTETSILPTPTAVPSDEMTDIENDFSKLDTSTLDVK